MLPSLNKSQGNPFLLLFLSSHPLPPSLYFFYSPLLLPLSLPYLLLYSLPPSTSLWPLSHSSFSLFSSHYFLPLIVSFLAFSPFDSTSDVHLLYFLLLSSPTPLHSPHPVQYHRISQYSALRYPVD